MSIMVERIDGLGAVSPEAWDALVPVGDPFCEHAFLYGLEESGSVGPRTGWVPCHLLVKDDGRLVGALPLYLKDNSYGEYIFDWGWARAANGAGLAYYPKLVSSVPFTPATGRRFLIHPESDPEPVFDVLLRALSRTADELGAHSIHVLFLTGEEQRLGAEAGFLPRDSCQYHFENTEGWETFDDYLGALRSRNRKQVRKERRLARSHGLDLRVWTGDEMGDAEWDAMWTFYNETISRKWGMPYLTQDFFRWLRTHFAHRVRVAFAHDEGRPVAGSLLFEKDHQLFGRYWGAAGRYEGLHFELCYYAPLEWALSRGLTRFEAGAQGEHKIKRGLLPSVTRSLHWIRHPGLGEAVADFIEQERAGVAREMDYLADRSPYRRDDDPGRP